MTSDQRNASDFETVGGLTDHAFDALAALLLALAERVDDEQASDDRANS